MSRAMTIQWKQVAWNTPKQQQKGQQRGQNGKKPEKKAYKWEGKRKDGRSFKITLIQRLGTYLAYTFNGTKIGEGKSLSEAQNICEDAPQASNVGVKQCPAPVQVATA